MSKRVKINFETINKGNYKIIPAKDIDESRRRIKSEMSDIYKKILKKQFNIEYSDSQDLRDMNTVTEEQAKKHNLLTDEEFKKFKTEVINKKLP